MVRRAVTGRDRAVRVGPAVAGIARAWLSRLGRAGLRWMGRGQAVTVRSARAYPGGYQHGLAVGASVGLAWRGLPRMGCWGLVRLGRSRCGQAGCLGEQGLGLARSVADWSGCRGAASAGLARCDAVGLAWPGEPVEARSGWHCKDMDRLSRWGWDCWAVARDWQGCQGWAWRDMVRLARAWLSAQGLAWLSRAGVASRAATQRGLDRLSRSGMAGRDPARRGLVCLSWLGRARQRGPGVGLAVMDRSGQAGCGGARTAGPGLAVEAGDGTTWRGPDGLSRWA